MQILVVCTSCKASCNVLSHSQDCLNLEAGLICDLFGGGVGGFLTFRGGASTKKEFSTDLRCPEVGIINTSYLLTHPLPGPLKLDRCKCCGYAYLIILVAKNIVNMIKHKLNYTWCIISKLKQAESYYTSPCLMLFNLQYEVQVLRSLSHPNILPFYCSFVTQQEVWHVLPLMQFGMCLPYDYTCNFSNPFKTVPQGKLKGPPMF